MPEVIPEFHVIELPTPLHAEMVANFLSHYIGTVYQRNRAGDGAGRPVIWAGSPLAATGVLYLSPGVDDNRHLACTQTTTASDIWRATGFDAGGR